MPKKPEKEKEYRELIDLILGGLQRKRFTEILRFLEERASFSVSRITVWDLLNREMASGSPIEYSKTGKYGYFQYTRPFALSGLAFKADERVALWSLLGHLDQINMRDLSDTVRKILDKAEPNRRKGIPKFSDRLNGILDFETNIDASGTEHLEGLLLHCFKKQSLIVSYQVYGEEIKTFNVEPGWLKQYNHRWYLICRCSGQKWGFHHPTSLPLDRIKSFEINPHHEGRISDIEINSWKENFFYDIIGVTVIEGSKTERVRFQVKPNRAYYVESRPLHPTQKGPKKVDGWKEYTIDVRVNIELRNELYRLLPDIRVLEPESLINIMQGIGVNNSENPR